MGEDQQNLHTEKIFMTLSQRNVIETTQERTIYTGTHRLKKKKNFIKKKYFHSSRNKGKSGKLNTAWKIYLKIIYLTSDLYPNYIKHSHKLIITKQMTQ